MNKVLFALGILLAIISAMLMILDVLPLPARITILIVGISLIVNAIAISRKAKKS